VKSFLVTGASGYIGSHMCYELRKTYPDCKIIGVDKVQKNKLNHLYDQFYCYDLSKPNYCILDKSKIDCIFHFAAYASVPESEEKPWTYYRNNMMAGFNLLEEAIFYRVKNFIFSSTCAVYGSRYEPVHEDIPKNPQSIYAKTKSNFEDILLAAEKESGIRATILRYFNVAGRNVEANLYEEHEPETHLIPNLMKAEIAKIYGNKFSTPDRTAIRDYIHVIDLCKAHVVAYEIMEKNNKGIVCNIGTGKGYSVLEILNEIRKFRKLELEYYDKRPGDLPILISDVKRMKEQLTFTPEHDIVSIIESMKEP
jgi:UDP-glucose 4-epimerase